MSSYFNTIDTISNLQEEAKVWTSGAIWFPLATSLSDDTVCSVDIASTIGHSKQVPHTLGRNDLNCLWFPSSFNVNSEQFRMKQLYPLIVRSCSKAGFHVGCRYYKNRTNVIVSCDKSRFSNQDKSKEYYVKRSRIVQNPDKPPAPKKSKTVRAIKSCVDHNVSESTCPFKFHVYWDATNNRWFIPRQGSGCIRHEGHLRIDPECVRMVTRHALPDHQHKVATDSLETGIDTTSTAGLIEKRTGLSLSWQQVHYLKAKNRNALLLSDDSSTLHPDNATAADRLLSWLSTDSTKSYVALMAEFNSNLITIKTRSIRPNHAAEIREFDSDLDDDTDSPARFAESLRKRLGLSSSGKLLLLIAWTSNRARLRFDKFPEFMGIDDTDETNSENRPLLTACGRDNENQVFDIIRAFLPSRARWAYNWLFRFGFPFLLPGTALSRVTHIKTDACPNLTFALEHVIKRGIDSRHAAIAQGRQFMPSHQHVMIPVMIPWSLAMHAWCAWHLIDRNFINESYYKATLCQAKTSDIMCRVEIDTIVKWLWYLVKHYINEEEVNLSFELLVWYLSVEDQSHHFGKLEKKVRDIIKEFLVKTFYPKREKVFEPFQEGLTLFDSTSSGNESENRALKKHALGPRPKHDLAEAALRIDDVSTKKDQRKQKQTSYDINSTYSKVEDRKSNVKGVTDYANKLLSKEYIQSSKLCLFRNTDNTFLIKWDYHSHQTTDNDDLESNVNICDKLLDNINVELESASGSEKKALR
ncbi:hypothetical protein ACHAWF_002826, partial [Thalassiosira exigua]